MAARELAIGGRRIGFGCPAFVVAEAGVNHNGDLDMARRLVDAAAAAGADAVKFQTFRTDALVTRSAPKAGYQAETTGDGGQREMLARLELSPDAHAVLRDRCHERGIVFFSAPFDEASVDLLARLDVSVYKVPSGEVTNFPLLRHIAAQARPVILSTGMCTLEEVARAVETLRDAGDPPLAVLHCVSAYPAPAGETNLRAMDTLRERFRCPVGLSDHSLGVEIAIAAVARGAELVEKHLTLDRSLPGPDHRASLDPDGFAGLVRALRAVESALGDGEKRPMPSEADTRRVARKSLVAARPIRAGERLAAADVAIKRPGTGVPPGDLPRVLGRAVLRDLAPDDVIDWGVLA
ncbi:MAG TPA: N-acetylneuraminate synthase [Methylomirabilota bacterium]|nr:N-acetylneuraminate synthase [Methylomirabilota bacterium]